MSDSVLVLSNIYKSFYLGTPKQINVLKGIDLTIEKGEIVALVAPSGAGKSTLLHIAGLLDKPDSGEISMAGESENLKSDRVRTDIRKTKVGFVYQSHNLLPEFSALENIILPQLVAGKLKKNALKRARILLEKVGVDHRGNHRPGTLSGGEQQRVAFCRALANKPKLLLADEPTGNLDTETSTSVFDTIINLAKETGLSAIVATHNLDLASRLDRIIYLNKGVIN
ncbi:MAG: ABC transporter ATP-binding protein [Paracoccaceae bacterium]|mgnify:CR=1 FL=1|jgi:lipoprotein-releasing system ATP-binding protein